tara:strand:- start:179 stop:373 length:195 start_codon:yes stop_codon:yes gene_type:complete
MGKENKMETFEITKEERRVLLQYMWKRPYGEVAQFIAILAGLKPLKTGKKNGKEDKEDMPKVSG